MAGSARCPKQGIAGPSRCELCGAAGRVCCQGCRLTSYCDVDHQQADWVSVHEQICQLLIPIRTSPPCPLSEEERKHNMEQLEKRQKHIIELTSRLAQQFILDGKHEQALPAALHALRFSTEVYSSNSEQLVPPYLLLAEASAGAGHPLQASKYLSQAEWIVLRTPDCSIVVRCKLQRGLGLFCAAEGNLDQALYHLANEVYLASATFGLKSVEAAGGYFHMANIFLRQNKMDVANSLFTEVTSIWHAFLLKSVQAQEQALESRQEISPFTEEKEIGEDPMTEAQRAELSRILSRVLNVREKAPKQQPWETARVLHALAMLHYLGKDLPKAAKAATRALELVKQLPQPESLEAISHLLKLIESEPSHMK